MDKAKLVEIRERFVIIMKIRNCLSAIAIVIVLIAFSAHATELELISDIVLYDDAGELKIQNRRESPLPAIVLVAKYSTREEWENSISLISENLNDLTIVAFDTSNGTTSFSELLLNHSDVSTLLTTENSQGYFKAVAAWGNYSSQILDAIGFLKASNIDLLSGDWKQSLLDFGLDNNLKVEEFLMLSSTIANTAGVLVTIASNIGAYHGIPGMTVSMLSDISNDPDDLIGVIEKISEDNRPFEILSYGQEEFSGDLSTYLDDSGEYNARLVYEWMANSIPLDQNVQFYLGSLTMNSWVDALGVTFDLVFHRDSLNEVPFFMNSAGEIGSECIVPKIDSDIAYESGKVKLNLSADDSIVSSSVDGLQYTWLVDILDSDGSISNSYYALDLSNCSFLLEGDSYANITLSVSGYDDGSFYQPRPIQSKIHLPTSTAQFGCSLSYYQEQNTKTVYISINLSEMTSPQLEEVYVDFGDGEEQTYFPLDGNIQTVFSHDYSSTGEFPVRVVILSEDGQRIAIASTTAIINNVGSPVAIISAASTEVNVGDAVELDGSSSYDPDEGDSIEGTHSWEIIAPDGSRSTKSGESISFTADQEGSYTVTLTVSDGDLEGSESVEITVTKEYSETELVELQEGRFAYTNIDLDGCELEQIATLTVPDDEIWDNVTFATSREIDVILLVDDDEEPDKDGSKGCPDYAQDFDSDKEWDLLEQGGFPEWTKDLSGGDKLRVAVFSYDGISDYQFTVDIEIDKDADGDEVPDDNDAFPNDPDEQYDSDDDGVGDNTDKFPNDPAASVDSDDDGYPDEWNSGKDQDDSTTGLELDHSSFVKDSTEWADSDDDGVGDNTDQFDYDSAASIDSDEDGYPDSWNDGKDENDSETGLQLDKFIDDESAAIDDDDDGYPDLWNPGMSASDSTTGLILDMFPDDPSEWMDSDLDGIGDNSDWAPNDITEWIDSDEDGVGDNSDALPSDPDRSTNTSPSINEISPITVRKNESVQVTIVVSDDDGDTVSLNLIDAPTFVSLNDGTLTITPLDSDETGDYEIQLIATDSYGGMAYENASVTVSSSADTDTDLDGLSDTLENSICTDPNDADTDDDGILDGDEDADHDGVLGLDDNETDPCSSDTDNDGIQDGTETGVTEDDIGSDTDTTIFQADEDPSTTTDPTLADTDGDSISDGDEDVDKNGQVDSGESDPNAVDSAVDSDGDGLSDSLEESMCTDPNDADTDDDGILDGDEDADHDGVLGLDDNETDPCSSDTDNDGIQDGTEAGVTEDDIGSDTDTTVFQADEDPSTTTDPTLADTDGDGVSDGDEDLDKDGQVDSGESDPNADQDDGLVAYYSFDGNANDESGNGNNGTEYGDINYATGKVGQAANFDGSGDYIQTGSSDSLKIGDLTISAWIYWNGENGKTQFIACQGTTFDTTGNFQFAINENANLYLNVNNSSSWTGSTSTILSQNTMTSDKWHHVVATFSDNTLKYYIDGELDSSEAYNISQFNSTSAGIKIGDREYGGSYFNGMIDELYIYSRALSDSEIQELYNISLEDDNCDSGPNKVNQVSPSGTEDTSTPTFTWEEDSCSTWYKLWIGYNDSERVFQQWYDSTEICSDETCSITLNSELENTDFIWYIRSWNEDGWIWSDGMSFSVSDDSNSTPESADASTFTYSISEDGVLSLSWDTISNATWYLLWIGDSYGDRVFRHWYSDSEVNSDNGSCSIAPDYEFSEGLYIWYIKTWNENGPGGWSGGAAFNVD